jgi:hypothetical protein
MKKLWILVGLVALFLFGMATGGGWGFYLGRIRGNLAVYQIGYDQGYNSGVSDAYVAYIRIGYSLDSAIHELQMQPCEQPAWIIDGLYPLNPRRNPEMGMAS